MRFLFLIVGLLLALVALGAEGAMKAGPPMAGPGHHRLKAVSGGTPPLDGFTAPSGAYSFRKLLTAYLGNAVRIRRASDNAEIDVGFLGFVPGLGSAWDAAAANAHCAATTCSIVFWYDQSGANRHIGQVTPANQPALVFGCTGFLPCMQLTIATQGLSAAAVTPATGLASLGAVANRVSGTGFCVLLRQNGNTGNRLMTNNVAGQWALGGSAGTVIAAASTGAWHAAIGVTNGASSVLMIDGADTAGSLTNATGSGAFGTLGAATTVCQQGEVVYWDNYGLTPAERTALTANQRAFWGF